MSPNPFTVSIQHRCPQMARHDEARQERLPVPCPECYSVAVTSVLIPYQPSVRWTEIGRPAA